MKYRNKKTVHDGLKFDSLKERNRYIALKQDAAVTDLRTQVRFPLKVSGILIATYVADFVYTRNGVTVVEDVKSAFTAKLAPYRMKKKLMLAIHGIDIQEV